MNAIAGNPIFGYDIPTLSPYRSWLYTVAVSMWTVKSSKINPMVNSTSTAQVHLMKSEVVHRVIVAWFCRSWPQGPRAPGMGAKDSPMCSTKLHHVRCFFGWFSLVQRTSWILFERFLTNLVTFGVRQNYIKICIYTLIYTYGVLFFRILILPTDAVCLPRH